MRGDVLGDHRGSDDLPLSIAHQRARERDIARRPVLRHAYRLELLDPLTFPDALQVLRRLVLPVGRGEDRDVLANSFFGGVPVEAFGPHVPTGDDSVERDSDDRVFGGLHDGRKAGPTLLGLRAGPQRTCQQEQARCQHHGQDGRHEQHSGAKVGDARQGHPLRDARRHRPAEFRHGLVGGDEPARGPPNGGHGGPSLEGVHHEWIGGPRRQSLAAAGRGQDVAALVRDREADALRRLVLVHEPLDLLEPVGGYQDGPCLAGRLLVPGGPDEGGHADDQRMAGGLAHVAGRHVGPADPCETPVPIAVGEVLPHDRRGGWEDVDQPPLGVGNEGCGDPWPGVRQLSELELDLLEVVIGRVRKSGDQGWALRIGPNQINHTLHLLLDGPRGEGRRGPDPRLYLLVHCAGRQPDCRVGEQA